MFRPFMRASTSCNDLLLDCGDLGSLDLLPSNEKDRVSWVSEKCATPAEDGLEFGVTHPPTPLHMPDSAFRSRFPQWTINDYIHRLRNDRCVLYKKRNMTKLLNYVLNTRRRSLDALPLWLNELVDLKSGRHGPGSDSKHLKNCLAVAELGEDQFLFAHPVSDKHNVLLISRVLSPDSCSDQPSLSFSSSLVMEKHASSPINQVEAQFEVDEFAALAKIAYKTEEALELVSLNPMSDRPGAEQPKATTHRLALDNVIDFLFSPHVESEFAYLDSSGNTVLLNLDNPQRSDVLKSMSSPAAGSSIGLVWTDHPRILVTYDSETLRQVDTRSGKNGILLWSVEDVETIENVEPMHYDSNYAAIVTSRCVHLCDFRQRNSTLTSRGHMLLDRPKYSACSPLFRAKEDQLIFIAGRESCEVVACHFQWRESNMVIRSPRAPFRLCHPEEPILWLDAHQATASIPRTLVHRLRAPLRGFKLLPYEAKDFVVPIMLNDVGDVFYQLCGVKSTTSKEFYDEKRILDSWSPLIVSSRSDFERNLSTVTRIDLSKNPVYTSPKRTTDVGRVEQKCPLCLTELITQESDIPICGICNLTADRACMVSDDSVPGGRSESIDPRLANVIADDDSEATKALLPLF